MADPEPFTISSRRLSYKDLELTYRDASRTLIVPVEMSGIREFDFVGVDTSFAQWADPPGLTLSAEEQSAVKSRIHQWRRAKVCALASARRSTWKRISPSVRPKGGGSFGGAMLQGSRR
jgi:hypothetical protein